MKYFLMVLSAALLLAIPVRAADILDVTISSDEVVEIFTVKRNGSSRNDEFMAWVNVTGSFGSGTITLKKSTDGGTTKSDVMYYSGGALTAFSFSDTTNFKITEGWPNVGTDGAIYYASMSGSTSPSVTINGYDNR